MDELRIEIDERKIKKVKFALRDKEIEVTARFSLSDMEVFSSEIANSQDYKHVLATVIHAKIVKIYPEIKIEEIIEQEDDFFYGFVGSFLAENEDVKDYYESISDDVSVIDRFCKAYKAYVDEMVNNMSTALQPIIDNWAKLMEPFSVNNVFAPFQQSLENLGKAFLDKMEGINRIGQVIAEALQPFQKIADNITRNLSNIDFLHVSEDEFNSLQASYIKWGEQGWSVLPNAPFNFFDEFPEKEIDANKLAMDYCNKDSMEHLFEELGRMKIRKTDFRSAVFCYSQKQYKACALLLFGIIDARLIRFQPKTVNRQVGLRATNYLETALSEKSSEEQLLFATLYQINLLTCLKVFFAKGDNFKCEPTIINRNYIDHGMSVREVRKRDCVQLFVALYNLCQIMDEM